MSAFRIPGKNRKWQGIFPGQYSGNVWATRNIDLERATGRIALGGRGVVVKDSSDSGFTNLTTITKFLQSNAADNHATNSRWYALCSNSTTGGRIFRTATAATPPAISGTYEEDTTSGVPTDALDMETHESVNGEQRLIVSRANAANAAMELAILNKAGGENAWDVDWGSTVAFAGLTLPTQTAPRYHPLARLQRLLAIGDGGFVHTIDKNDVATVSRLTLPYGYNIRGVYTSSDRFWIAATGSYGQQAAIFEWDGFSLTYNNQFDLVGQIPLTMFIDDNIPYVITEPGYFFKYAGGSFKHVHQFPIAEDGVLFGETDITQYGSAVNRNIVYILANNMGGVGYRSRKMRAGLWTYNTITDNLTQVTGFGSFKTAGTDSDFSQSPLNTVGGVKFDYAQSAIFAPFIVAGGSFISRYTESGTEAGVTELKYALFRNRTNYLAAERSASSLSTNRGQITTSFNNPDFVRGMFEGVWVKFKKFVDSNNRIIVKARVNDPAFIVTGDSSSTDSQVRQKNIIWQTTTTFTCTVQTGVAVGDEVEILTGNGAGCTFHISSFSATPDNSTSITVTVDEALPSLNAVNYRAALARFDNWVKCGTISTTTEGSAKVLAPQAMHGELIQVRLELRGYEVEIDDIIPVFSNETEVKML